MSKKQTKSKSKAKIGPVKKKTVVKPAKKKIVKKTKPILKKKVAKAVKVTVPKEDKTPEFFDIDDKNIRNNFGMPTKSKSEINTELERINARLKENSYEQKHEIKHEPTYEPTYEPRHESRHEPVPPYSKNKHQQRIAKIIAYMFVVIIVIIILIGALIYIPPMLEESVENGVCIVKMKTYVKGEKETLLLDLPDTECQTEHDCEDELLERRFSKWDIRLMSLECVEKS